MLGQGREGTISFSVEEVDEYAEENEEPEQDCEASASKIKVIETSFDTPRKSSFRVKKGMRREVSVHYSETPDIVGTDKEDTDVTETENTLSSFSWVTSRSDSSCCIFFWRSLTS